MLFFNAFRNSETFSPALTMRRCRSHLDTFMKERTGSLQISFTFIYAIVKYQDEQKQISYLINLILAHELVPCSFQTCIIMKNQRPSIRKPYFCNEIYTWWCRLQQQLRCYYFTSLESNIPGSRQRIAVPEYLYVPSTPSVHLLSTGSTVSTYHQGCH